MSSEASSPALDSVSIDFPLFLRALSHLDLLLLVLGPSHLDFSLASRSSAQLGPVALLMGCARLGSLSSLSVAGSARSELASLPRSSSCCGVASSISESSHLGFSSAARAVARPGVALSPCGASLDVSPSASDLSVPEPSMSSRSFAQMESATSILDSASVGSSTSLHSSVRAGSSPLIFGASLGTSPSALDFSHLESSSLTRSLLHLDSSPSTCHAIGSSVLVPSLTESELTSSLQSLACSGLAVPVLDPTAMGSSPLIHSHAQLSASTSLLGTVCLDLALFMLDSAASGSSLSLRTWMWMDLSTSLPGAACFGVPPLVTNLSQLDLPLSPRSFSCAGSSLLPTGSARAGSSLLVLDSLHLDLSLPLQSSLQPGASIMVLDAAALGFSLSLRSLLQLGSLLLLLGVSRLGSLFALPVVGSTNLELLLPLRSSSHLSPVTLVSDFQCLDFSAAPRSLARLGAASSCSGSATVDSLLLILDLISVGPSTLPKSSGQLGPPLSTLNFASPDFFVSTHSPSHLESTPPAIGILRVGPISPPSATDASSTGSSPSLQSLSKLDVLPPACDFAVLGASLSPRQLRAETSPSAPGIANLELSLSILEDLQMASSTSLRGPSRIDLAPSISDLVSSDASSLVRSSS